jgi:endonuclease/exonuclease/phosphatase family metal-dependent hydrolase
MDRDVRIATWNVERPKPHGWKIPVAQLQRMQEVDADIWVLTETHLHHAPSPDHEHWAACPVHPERRPEPERWTMIWSRWPLTQIDEPPPHHRGTVAATVEAPSGPILVFGTVIAWANESAHDDGRPARMWEVHLEEIARQGAEWRQVRKAFPNHPMVLAGDFNQNLDGARWYGTQRTRAALRSALDGADLLCITDEDCVAAGHLEAHHLVDHICVTPDVASDARLRCWEPTDEDGRRLSDHPTVAVDLRIPPQR